MLTSLHRRSGHALVWMLLVYGAAVGLTSCSGSPPPPFNPVADVKLLMEVVVDPAADVIWDSVGTIITAAGENDRRPRTPEQWAMVRNAAVTLAESGNLLMMAPRAYDSDEWMQMSQALVDVGNEALKRADVKNAEGVFERGGEIYDACETRHKLYSYEDAPKRKR